MRIDDAGRIQVYAQSLGDVASAAAAVNRAGGLVQRQDAKSGIVQALVPIPEISELATSPSVRFVRLPDYGIPQAGSVTTEGDAILKANLARADHGIDGSGVRVGVISDGVGGLNSSQASGDLPSVNTSTCNISGTDPQSTGAEGTALLEIVHDIAPGAELWFGHFETGLDFLAAVHCLAAHTDVVVDDISFLNAGLYDGTSIISATTSANLNDNANPVRAYVTNAGNFALSHYQENYFSVSIVHTSAVQGDQQHSRHGCVRTTVRRPRGRWPSCHPRCVPAVERSVDRVLQRLRPVSVHP